MKTIYKYPVSDACPVTRVIAPIVKPLKVDYQCGVPTLWAVVDTDKQPSEFFVFRVGTGHDLPEMVQTDSYLNTTVAESCPYVWHWFCPLELFPAID